jgi:hypothetical protein
MVTRWLGVLLVFWTSATALAAPEAAPSSPRETDNPVPIETAAPSQQRSEDDELIRNLDMIEQLELLDTLEALGAMKAPEPSEEEF